MVYYYTQITFVNLALFLTDAIVGVKPNCKPLKTPKVHQISVMKNNYHNVANLQKDFWHKQLELPFRHRFSVTVPHTVSQTQFIKQFARQYSRSKLVHFFLLFQLRNREVFFIEKCV